MHVLLPPAPQPTIADRFDLLDLVIDLSWICRKPDLVAAVTSSTGVVRAAIIAGPLTTSLLDGHHELLLAPLLALGAHDVWVATIGVHPVVLRRFPAQLAATFVAAGLVVRDVMVVRQTCSRRASP